MAIRTVVTGGYGNESFATTIALVVTRGYAIGDAVVAPVSPTSRTIIVGARPRTIIVPARSKVTVA